MTKVSERLYNTAIGTWNGYLSHPFVTGIADGTLPLENFQYYMIQDHKYLMQYAKVFALGVVKAEKEQDMRDFAAVIPAILDTENTVHQAYLNDLKITPEMVEKTPMSLWNESYTSYMIAIAEKEGIAEIATAVLACSWSYKVIGDWMKEHACTKENLFFGRWIDMYSSETYSESNDEMIAMIDRMTEGYSEEKLQHLDEIILRCSEYEEKFWDMSWRMD